MNTYPRDILLAITYRCNCRCSMCKLWEAPEVPELPAEEYRKIKNVDYVNLTGGEPFLREDIVDIVRHLKASGNRVITVCTNGLVPGTYERIQELRRVQPRLRVVVAIDGIGKRHDQIRGVDGAFKTCSDLLMRLATDSSRDLRVGFVAGSRNIDGLMDVYRLARSLGIEVSLSATYNSNVRYHTMENDVGDLKVFRKHFLRLIRAELSSWSPKRLLRAYYAHGLLKFVETGERALPPGHSSRGVFIRPDGCVVLSLVSGAAIGSLADCDELADLFKTDHAAKTLQEVADLPVPWLVNNVRSQMRRYALPVSWWVLKNKFFGVESD